MYQDDHKQAHGENSAGECVFMVDLTVARDDRHDIVLFTSTSVLTTPRNPTLAVSKN